MDGSRGVVALACVGAALLAAACGPGPSTMRMVNRTQVPVVVAMGDSDLVVAACAERTVVLANGVWGGGNTGLPHVEEQPQGAYVLRLPWYAQQPGAEGHLDVVLMLAGDYIGFRDVGSQPDPPIAGTGTFPPDPAAPACAGSPPPQPPSPSPAPGSAAP